jgi:hypothetical protein
MEASNLPTLHKFISNGWQLRNEMAKAISSVEIYAKKGSVTPAAAAKLTALFTAGNAAVAAVLNYPASIVASAADVALSLASDTSEQIVVTATELDGGTSNVAASATYKSSDVTKGTVSSTGLVTAVAVGSFTVTAKYQNKTSNALAFTVAV